MRSRLVNQILGQLRVRLELVEAGKGRIETVGLAPRNGRWDTVAGPRPLHSGVISEVLSIDVHIWGQHHPAIRVWNLHIQEQHPLIPCDRAWVPHEDALPDRDLDWRPA